MTWCFNTRKADGIEWGSKRQEATCKQKERMNWVKYRQHVKKTRKRNKKIKKKNKKTKKKRTFTTLASGLGVVYIHVHVPHMTCM